MMFYIPKRDEKRMIYDMILTEMRKRPEEGYRSKYLANRLGYEAQEIGEQLAKMRDYGIVRRFGKNWYLSE